MLPVDEKFTHLNIVVYKYACSIYLSKQSKSLKGQDIYNVVYQWGAEGNDLTRPLRYGCRTPYDRTLCNHNSIVSILLGGILISISTCILLWYTILPADFFLQVSNRLYSCTRSCVLYLHNERMATIGLSASFKRQMTLTLSVLHKIQPKKRLALPIKDVLCYLLLS
jgi:hypothetical protein